MRLRAIDQFLSGEINQSLSRPPQTGFPQITPLSRGKQEGNALAQLGRTTEMRETSLRWAR